MRRVKVALGVFALAWAVLFCAIDLAVTGTAQASPIGREVVGVKPVSLTSAHDLGPANERRVDFSIVLPYQHARELRYLLKAQQDRGSKYYRRFVTATQFRAYFSPTTDAYQRAAMSLIRAGFFVSTFENRTVLHAYGTARNASRYFQTRIDLVRWPDGRLGYANIGTGTIPLALAGSRIVGLNDVQLAIPASSMRDRSASRLPATATSPLFGPDGGFGPLAIEKAEDFPLEHGYRGRNSNVADVIDGVVSDSDVSVFLHTFHLQRGGPRTTKLLVDGGCGTTCINGRAAVINAEWILGMAPSSSLFTYQLPSLTLVSIIDGFNAVASDNAVNIVHFSVGLCEVNSVDFDLAVEPIFAQGAAEGITFESADFGGANLCNLGTLALPMTPANLSEVTAVGASSTFVSSEGLELAQSAFNLTNGGVSVVVPLPSWQVGVTGIKPGGRNAPDVVIPGSVDGVGPSVFFAGQWQGGDAFANNAPFAGYLATVQEMYGYTTPLGNVAPDLYAVLHRYGYPGASAAYYTDITLGCIGAVNGAPVCAAPGYDLATGIGSIARGFALAQAFALGPIAPPE